MPAVSFWNLFAELNWGNTYIKGLPGEPSGMVIKHDKFDRQQEGGFVQSSPYVIK